MTFENKMGDFFEQMDKEQRLQFALCLRSILGYYELTKIFKFLTNPQKKELALNCGDILGDSTCLSYMLLHLDIDDRIDVALKHIVLIKEMSDYFRVLRHMSGFSKDFHREFMESTLEVLDSYGGITALNRFVVFEKDKEYFNGIYLSCHGSGELKRQRFGAN